ncbi:cytochrome c oxidase assembly protein [Amorphus orientalis]|uniref:Cytochrome c oxidase assembly protein CtaG n=1 Tax=Amorphus orientalis TaxID=649198 RepID=A0AAE3VRA6_9HYPH|nr:cytochrome c oxidase assembly protein [Amorphus orientalis]MDQ0316711.1 cytochrome c oxidase assembly protein subunit 11 [Amorphus orientalis]
MSERTRKSMNGNVRVAVVCLAFVCAMVGAAYAAVPLYQIFCQVTGYGGTTSLASAQPVEPIDREVTVRFDANVRKGLPWTFKPVERSITARMGEVVEAEYIIENTSERETNATAVFNVTPFAAGPYFSKLDCFCFTQQPLGPSEKRRITVTYYVDPDMVTDDEAGDVGTITLSYTFYPADPPDQSADAGDQDATDDATRPVRSKS